jgi:hypothetical protein
MKKGYLIYIPLILIFVIQLFDKEDKFFVIQLMLLALMIIALILKLSKRNN